MRDELIKLCEQYTTQGTAMRVLPPRERFHGPETQFEIRSKYRNDKGGELGYLYGITEEAGKYALMVVLTGTTICTLLTVQDCVTVALSRVFVCDEVEGQLRETLKQRRRPKVKRTDDLAQYGYIHEARQGIVNIAAYPDAVTLSHYGIT